MRRHTAWWRYSARGAAVQALQGYPAAVPAKPVGDASPVHHLCQAKDCVVGWHSSTVAAGWFWTVMNQPSAQPMQCRPSLQCCSTPSTGQSQCRPARGSCFGWCYTTPCVVLKSCSNDTAWIAGGLVNIQSGPAAHGLETSEVPVSTMESIVEVRQACQQCNMGAAITCVCSQVAMACGQLNSCRMSAKHHTQCLA
jgi:hypothetical protein